MYNHILHYVNPNTNTTEVKKKIYQAIAEKFISDWSTAITLWKDYFAEAITLDDNFTGEDYYTTCC